MLSQKQVDDICLAYGGHKMCRYLVYDQQTGKHLCVKKVDQLRDEIDKRVEKHIEKAKANGQDLVMLGRTIGDGNSCKGYLYLKNKVQGYDIPGSV